MFPNFRILTIYSFKIRVTLGEVGSKYIHSCVIPGENLKSNSQGRSLVPCRTDNLVNSESCWAVGVGRENTADPRDALIRAETNQNSSVYKALNQQDHVKLS